MGKLRSVLDYWDCGTCLGKESPDQEVLCSICRRLDRDIVVGGDAMSSLGDEAIRIVPHEEWVAVREALGETHAQAAQVAEVASQMRDVEEAELRLEGIVGGLEEQLAEIPEDEDDEEAFVTLELVGAEPAAPVAGRPVTPVLEPAEPEASEAEPIEAERPEPEEAPAPTVETVPEPEEPSEHVDSTGAAWGVEKEAEVPEPEPVPSAWGVAEEAEEPTAEDAPSEWGVEEPGDVEEYEPVEEERPVEEPRVEEAVEEMPPAAEPEPEPPETAVPWGDDTIEKWEPEPHEAPEPRPQLHETPPEAPSAIDDEIAEIQNEIRKIEEELALIAAQERSLSERGIKAPDKKDNK